MKLIYELKSIKELNKVSKLSNVEMILVGTTDISLNPSVKFTKEELTIICNKLHKLGLKVVLNIERLFKNNELSLINNYFTIINECDYITYSDFGVKEYLDAHDVKIKYIYNAPTYMTNASDVNMYRKLNDYVCISNEISSDELIVLTKQLKENNIVTLFSLNQIFYSKRKLLTNYFKYRNLSLNPQKLNYKIVEELRDDVHRIVEDETGSHIFDSKYSYLLEEISELKHIDYGFVRTNFMTIKDAYLIIKAYDDYLNNYDQFLFKITLSSFMINMHKGAYQIKSILLKKGAQDE